MKKTWTTILKDVGDGSGDAYVELPPELIEEKGWKEGDDIPIEVKDGKIYLG